MIGSLSLLCLVFAIVYVFLREPAHARFSRELSLEDQKQIAGMIRRHSVANAFVAINSGRFGFAMARFKDLPWSVVYAQGTQSDGKIWVHVGVPDTNVQDGYRLFSRHLLEKRENGWVLVNDF